MSKLRVWIHPVDVAVLQDGSAMALDAVVMVGLLPLDKTDLCYELVPVSREQLQAEAAEGLDEEGEK